MIKKPNLNFLYLEKNPKGFYKLRRLYYKNNDEENKK